MSPAAGGMSQSDRIPMLIPGISPIPVPGMLSEAFAKDAIISWYRGEFAAANAIIDELCTHITELEGGDNKNYKGVFAAIHRRRLNWVPVLQMQKFYPIADVENELREVARKVNEDEMVKEKMVNEEEVVKEKVVDEMDGADESFGGSNESPKSEITDTGSQEVQHRLQYIEICSKLDDCEARPAQINLTKGFLAKEPVKGHMVNVVRGLKLYDDIFADSELSKLTDYVNELRVAGQNGQLSGETFIMYNQAGQQVKGGIKRELIQLGVPIFGNIQEDAPNPCLKSHIEPIPATLHGVIEHLVQWNLIPENRKPNSCIINFFDEGEFSQPFMKPPHLDQPVSTLLLSESEMAFGRTLASYDDGKYVGSLMLSLKEGSFLVMRGNSADVARHAMCSSSNKRISITFFRVRMDAHEKIRSPMPPMTGTMTLWQPGVPNAYAAVIGALDDYEAMDLVPKWGILRTPDVVPPPVRPMVQSPKRMSQGGTGVFLPWNVNNSRKHTRHLPPRALKGRFFALSSAVETQKPELTSEADMISFEGK
ncbi:RNA demethylase ALKBH10B [Heracleum sosnowskyi]|uniref:RNA demethylase ALKBH10B n=1 Tax=Heracleum sosnowskyi TaxID=360622 RepID=A0AAD8GZM1_9APIA|nr:RNA demethylase ALKBH10B [Heracleum sosnowskyi]